MANALKDEQDELRQLSVTIKSPMWGPEEAENWLKFRKWIEANGGKWEEGLGVHRITFVPSLPPGRIAEKSDE
jgi:hypothetical protein